MPPVITQVQSGPVVNGWTSTVDPFASLTAPLILKQSHTVADSRFSLGTVFSYLAARPGRHEDLLRALVALRRYWMLHHRREGLELLEQAVAELSPADDPVLRAKALVTAASIAMSIDADACARYAQAGGELAAQVGDKATAALAAAAVVAVDGLGGPAQGG